MKKMIGLLIAALALVAQPALAQQAVGGRVVAGSPGYVVGETRPLTLDASGNLRVVSSGGGGGGAVSGDVANGAADSGNPVKIGCVYLGTLSAYTSGQRANCQSDAFGNQRARLATGIVAGADATSNNNLGTGVAANSAASDTYLGTWPFYFNGTTWDRQRSVVGSVSAGTGTGAMAIVPHTSAAGAIVPTASSAVTGALVVKASAGNLYEWRVVSGASAGYVLIFNATAAPADGAVTPLDCVPVAANSAVGSTATIPERYTTGITIVFSTTGCFTKTTSATAYIRARFQ